MPVTAFFELKVCRTCSPILKVGPTTPRVRVLMSAEADAVELFRNIVTLEEASKADPSRNA